MAITQGIVRIEKVTLCDESMIAYRGEGGLMTKYVHKPDWHTSFAEALRRAELMRERKLASLKKQEEKIRSIRFEEPA